jgi:hypothetical protein
MRRALLLASIAVAALAGSANAALPKLHVVVTAESHHPVLHRTWAYQVHVTANGKPVAAKIHIQVFFNGFSVGEVGTHFVKSGVWKETIPATGKDAFPPASVGQHVLWHAVATAKGYASGVGTWPISVIK